MEGCIVGSVLDSVHLVEGVGGEGLCPFQSSPSHAARSESYSRDLVWIEMMMVVDHKSQMVEACFFFPYSYLMKAISSAGRDSSFLFHGWFHFWSSDVHD